MSDKHTCPRRAEGGPMSDGVDQDEWETRHWRFTDVEEAQKWNDEEARKQNEEYAARGNKSVSHSNPRYWLWPGPGPKPRTCSYCGSINPEDVLGLKKGFKFTVERTTKYYKVYVHPPGWEIEMLQASVNVGGGVDPAVAYGASKVHEIYPPLKAYSPHFTDAQWKELNS